MASIIGTLRSRGIPAIGWDANLEGIRFLLERGTKDASTWSKQAQRKISAHLNDFRTGKAFTKFDAYKRAIKDFTRVLGKNASVTDDWTITLTDCEHTCRKAHRTEDLHWAFLKPRENPFFPFFSERLTAFVNEENPDPIGFSLNYLSQALTTFAMAGFVREMWPEKKLVLGGSLTACWMSNYPDFRKKVPFFDGLFSDPGEFSLPSYVLTALDVGSCHEKPGLGKGLHLDCPDFSDFTLDRYFSPGPIIPVSLSRGCYWRKCAFCAEQPECRPFFSISGPNAAKILTSLKNQYRPILFHFADSSLPPDLVRYFSENPLAVPWYGFIRFIDRFDDPKFCRKLADSGCVMLQLGLESGDDEVLFHMNKGITSEKASIALKNLKAAGIATYVYILFGTPFEDRRRAETTRDFIASHCESIDFLNLAIFSLPINVPEAATLETRPFAEGDLHLYYEFTHPKDWNRTTVRRFIEQEVKMHPKIRPIILRDPPSFTSNHAPLFIPDRVS